MCVIKPKYGAALALIIQDARCSQTKRINLISCMRFMSIIYDDNLYEMILQSSSGKKEKLTIKIMGCKMNSHNVQYAACVEHFNLNYINKYGGSRPLL